MGLETGHWREEQLLEERAFVEVQRADTKATALCGVAGGFLAAGIAVLSSARGVPPVCRLLVLLVCVLLVCAVGAALCALRPVVPREGLRTVLARRAGGSSPHSGGVSDGGGRSECCFQVLARLADRKLRTVRFSTDLVLVALVVAGICLLSGFAIG
ncbi:hypothetical protein [Streptomyces sp. SGAir0957]